MFGKKEEQIFFTFDAEYDKPKATAATHSKQECSMCGDVGFPDQLQQCTRCRFRFQHTYCCNSKEGLGTGVWMCDWCQIGKEATARNDRRGVGSQPCAAPSAAMASCTVSCVSGESAGALEFLLKAALNEAGVDAAAAGGGALSSNVDERSLGPSGIESVKGDNVRLGGDSGDAILGGSNRERISSDGEEEPAIVTSSSSSSYPCNTLENNNNGCDPKRNPKLLRCNSKTSQKRRHRSLLEQQCGSQVQLKRLSSLKGGKSGIACDPAKSFVRRYKSLSDISF